MIPRASRLGLATALSILLGACAAPAGGDAAGSPTQTTDLGCTLPTNCIRSSVGSAHAPLGFEGPPARAMALLRATLAEFPEARIVRADASTLEAVFTTPAGFRDDVDFRIDAERQRVDYRSRSSFGLFDFGKNRSRMAAFAARFEAKARQSN